MCQKKKKQKTLKYLQKIKPLFNIVGINQIQLFSKSIGDDGLLLKTKLTIATVIKNFNYFLYINNSFFLTQYPLLNNLFDEIFLKQKNYLYIFDLIMYLVKPPFIVRSFTIPKKFKKKFKQKFLIKIVYQNELKRGVSAFKQLHYYSNKFNDSMFKIRLYKALSLSFLE